MIVMNNMNAEGVQAYGFKGAHTVEVGSGGNGDGVGLEGGGKWVG